MSRAEQHKSAARQSRDVCTRSLCSCYHLLFEILWVGVNPALGQAVEQVLTHRGIEQDWLLRHQRLEVWSILATRLLAFLVLWSLEFISKSVESWLHQKQLRSPPCVCVNGSNSSLLKARRQWGWHRLGDHSIWKSAALASKSKLSNRHVMVSDLQWYTIWNNMIWER